MSWELIGFFVWDVESIDFLRNLIPLPTKSLPQSDRHELLDKLLSPESRYSVDRMSTMDQSGQSVSLFGIWII
jgi:hypothetical protein